MESFLEGLAEFMHAGFISFVIVLATVRAYLDKWLSALEEAGIPKVLIWGLVVVAGIYLIRMTGQCFSWVCGSREDEVEMMEVGILPRGARVVVLDLQRCRKMMDQRRHRRARRQGIKLGSHPNNHEPYPGSEVAL